jgi:FAD:protein FMN transferase
VTHRTEQIMGMPVTVKLVDAGVDEAEAALEAVMAYFRAVDERYSTYKHASEISRINAGLPEAEWSAEMRRVLELCEQTKHETQGYFNIWQGGRRDPSGLVKGWATWRAARLLRARGYENFFVEAGGDIQVAGHNAEGGPWRIGIRNPFNRQEVVKTVAVTREGVATSGTAARGQHVYDPHRPGAPLTQIVSLTVIGPNIYEADRFATAAFAMGRPGVAFIDGLEGFEGYMIDHTGVATMTRGFERYVA